jgi:hypothetical protein
MTPPISVVAAGNGHEPAPADAAPGSLLARLRSQAVQQAEDRTVEAPIGGSFDPPIMAVYGVLPPEELERYAELAGGTSNLELVLDMLVRTNRSLWTSDGERRVELRDDRGAVTYGHRLAELLGIPHPPDTELEPREVLLALFGRNGMALASHASQVVTWMQNPGGATPGESSGAAA